jgi:hypothetical protein
MEPIVSVPVPGSSVSVPGSSVSVPGSRFFGSRFPVLRFWFPVPGSLCPALLATAVGHGSRGPICFQIFLFELGWR